MKEILMYFISGLLSGVPGGMGLGGGTLLIPVLTIFCNLDQHIAQAVNLISFIPMAIIASIIHFKNNLIKKEGLIITILPALVFAIIGGIVAKNLNSQLLKKIFGGFLIVTGIFSFFADKINIQKLPAKKGKKTK